MTESINHKKLHRFIALNALYKAVEGDTAKWAHVDVAASAAGVRNAPFIEAFHYLKDSGLIKLYGSKYTAFITAAGVRTIEFMQTNVDKETEHFQSIIEMGL